MNKKVFVSGLVGAIVLIVWTLVLNGLLGFNARFNMKQVPNEREVHNILKTTITEPGRYLCNPALTPDGRFPDNEPVYGIRYSGVGHEAAGRGAILGLFQLPIVPSIGAWMLSPTSEQYRSRFVNRALFFLIIGLLSAIAGDLGGFGIGESSLALALLFAARTVATWTIVGLAIASLMRPARRIESTRQRDVAGRPTSCSTRRRRPNRSCVRRRRLARTQQTTVSERLSMTKPKPFLPEQSKSRFIHGAFYPALYDRPLAETRRVVVDAVPASSRHPEGRGTIVPSPTTYPPAASTAFWHTPACVRRSQSACGFGTIAGGWWCLTGKRKRLCEPNESMTFGEWSSPGAMSMMAAASRRPQDITDVERTCPKKGWDKARDSRYAGWR